MQAQNTAVLQTVSPYSRFGLGELNYNTGVLGQGLGGGGIGLRNDSLLPQYINTSNPASFTSHQITVYEVGLSSTTVQLQNASSTGTFNRTALSNMTLAFPIRKWWGGALGFAPYSNVGYNVSVNNTIQDIGAVTYKYQGSGGVNQVYMMHAFRPFIGLPRRFQLSERYDVLRRTGDTTAIHRQMTRLNHLSNISVGVQVSYLFGSLQNTRREEFPDSLFIYNTKISSGILFRDVYITGGLQYSFRLNRSKNPVYESTPDSIITNRNWLKNEFSYTTSKGTVTAPLFIKRPGIRTTVGLVFSPATEITVSYDLLAETYKLLAGFDRIYDTIANFSGIPGRVNMPAMAGIGIGLKRDYKWIFQADLMAQQWSQLSVLGNNSGLRNSIRATAGFQYQPKQMGRGNLITSTQYRIGFRYHQTALEFGNIGLNELAVNLGMAFPLPYRTRLGEPVSRVSINAEAGRRGTINNGLVQESFLRISLGITINDKWFNRYRID